MNLGKNELAAKNFKNALKLHPDFNLYTIIASVELAFDPDLALVHATKALEIEPNWEEARNILNMAKKLIAEKNST